MLSRVENMNRLRTGQNESDESTRTEAAQRGEVRHDDVTDKRRCMVLLCHEHRSRLLDDQRLRLLLLLSLWVVGH